MKELSDEEIQEMLDKNMELSGSEMPDVPQYQALFDLLDAEPEGGLAYDFPARVMKGVAVITDRRIALKWYLLAFLGGGIAIGLALILLSMFGSPEGNRVYLLIAEYKWPLVFISLVTMGVHYVDGRVGRVSIRRR